MSSQLKLSAPKWPALIGEAEEAAWIADRDRKADYASHFAERIQDAARALSKAGAVFRATPSILTDIPFSALWYVSLAGFSQKTLQNIRESPVAFGMTVRPGTLMQRLFSRASADDSLPASLARELPAFCAWVNDQIDRTHPIPTRNDERATIFVAEIIGGRIVGRGQNTGGDDAVVLVKDLFALGLQPEFGLEVKDDDGSWRPQSATHRVASATHLRFAGKLVCEFVSGGNRPDIKVFLDGELLAVGEIKGRKDLSNIWESWMPQVATHMRSWVREFPGTARLFFGTLINTQMIDGVSIRGTRHVGLKELHEDGALTSAYNISRVVAHARDVEPSFKELLDELRRVLRVTRIKA